MISPKEKARELYRRYLPTLLPVLNPKEEAKTYAIICVNEMYSIAVQNDNVIQMNYLVNVRKELELL